MLPSSRRMFLKSAAASGAAVLAPQAFAQTAEGPNLVTALVEVFNFRCPRCRAVGDWSSRIEAAAKAAGVLYRPAPIAWTADELWPDRFYYAARDLYPETAPLIREALFNGFHDAGQTYEALANVLAYLESSGTDAKAVTLNRSFNIVRVADRATTDEALYPIAKVVRLLEQTDAEEVPVFIWVQGGSITKAIGPSEASEPAVLARRVIAELSVKN